MRNGQDVILSDTASILQAIQIIDSNALQIALVTDDAGRLVGTVTDGDIRRALLRGTKLEDTIQLVMNPRPKVASNQMEKNDIWIMMKQSRLKQIPVIDSSNCVVGLYVWDDFVGADKKDNCIILMAGGLGSRLGEITNHCPKPLLSVGGKPLLETIIENFRDNGFWNIYLSVNYKAKMIERYFGDGSAWNVQIQYLQEGQRMGTAGALSLLPCVPDKPLIVMNGDLLTKVNFSQLLDFHSEHKAMATMCVKEYSFQVPYGVVEIDGHRLVGVQEKPVKNYYINGGIYVLEPAVLERIPQDSYYDMTSLFEDVVAQQWETGVFPIREYWIDIGRRDDLERANGEYEVNFGCP